MPDPSSFRDSTQILLPWEEFEGVREEVEERFTVSIVDAGQRVRIVGSPVEIKHLGEFLARQGINVP